MLWGTRMSDTEALEMAAKWRLAIFPVSVYESREMWDRPWDAPSEPGTWWCAVPCDASIYLPMEDYEGEWRDYVSYIDTAILTNTLAKTAIEAVRLAIEIKKKQEQEWENEKHRREKNG